MAGFPKVRRNGVNFVNFVFLFRLWETSIGWGSGKAVWYFGSTGYSRGGVRAFPCCRTGSTDFSAVMIPAAADHE